MSDEAANEPVTVAIPIAGAGVSLPELHAEIGLVGRVLAGRYRLNSVVAEGGMAMVYVGTDLATHSGRQVAVKVMHSDLTRERGFAARFKREAMIATRLDHPGILRVIDHGADGHLFFLVMDLLDGADIFDVLRAKKRLDEGLARRIVIDVLEALAAAHERGVVHRDLKPENVFLRRTGDEIRVTVLDFGVAKMVLPDDRSADEAETALTAVGTLLGTPEYLSPEMCLGEPVGPPADLYACGVLLYALLTGSPPFRTERPIDVTLKHISDEPLAPSELLPGLDLRLEDAILKALAKRPEGRHASAQAFADALRAVGPVPTLSPSLIEGAATQLRQLHAPDAPTLAVPNGLPRLYPSEFPPADDDAASDPRALGLEPAASTENLAALASPAIQSIQSIQSIQPGAPPRREVGATRVILVLIALVAAYAGGFASGRMTAPRPAPALTAP